MTYDDLRQRVCELLASAAAEFRAKLEAEGADVSGLGISLFLVGDEPRTVEQFSIFTGTIALIGEHAPEWAFALTRDLLEEPTEAFEGEEETIN